MRTREVTLPSGLRIRVRRVPDFALIRVGMEVPLPPEPVEVVQTMAGEERVPARPGSPEYQRYQEQFQEAIEKQERRRLGFVLAYGIVSWDGGDGWKSEIPDGWTLDPLLEPFSTGYPRGDYLLFELLVDAADIGEAVTAIRGPVIEEEVQAAERFFRGSVSGT